VRDDPGEPNVPGRRPGDLRGAMSDAVRLYLAAALTIVGGLFIMAGGVLLWLVGGLLAHLYPWASVVFLGGVFAGAIAVGSGGAMLAIPRARRAFGVLALLCAGASIPLAFGGFVIGFVLTAAGGAIAAARLRRVVVVTGTSTGRAPPWS
jgi:hypothetical protein